MKNNVTTFYLNIVLVSISFLLAGSIFVVDVNVPTDIIVSSLYSLVILYCWLLPWKYSEIYVAIFLSSLTIIAFVLKDWPESETISNLFILNVLFSILVIWVCSFLVLIARRGFQNMEEVQGLLESEVQSRTELLNTKIDELEVSQNNLQHKVNELENFAFILSHDLKSPVRAIAFLSESLVTDYHNTLDENGNNMLMLLKDRSYRLNYYIESILQYAVSGKDELTSETFLISEVVNNTIKNLNIATETNIVLDIKDAEITFYKIVIIQILSNLLSNAIKYNDKADVHVLIDAEKQDDFLILKVKDNGAGIPEQYQKRIFEIFGKVNNSISKESSGIGLSIVKKLVDKHNGTVNLQSEEGKGSEFTVKLRLL